MFNREAQIDKKIRERELQQYTTATCVATSDYWSALTKFFSSTLIDATTIGAGCIALTVCAYKNAYILRLHKAFIYGDIKMDYSRFHHITRVQTLA